MTENYMRLLTDVELNAKQKQVWYRCVEKFLGADYATEPTNFLDKLTSHRDELEGDEDFPFVYVVYLSDQIDCDIAEQIVTLWDAIYPRDFEIESSAELGDCVDCEECAIEIDDAMFAEIRKQADKYLHNRWVDTQIHEGWRFGINQSTKDKTSPRLRDWDNLREEYKHSVDMTRDQAITFMTTYPHIFN